MIAGDGLSASRRIFWVVTLGLALRAIGFGPRRNSISRRLQLSADAERPNTKFVSHSARPTVGWKHITVEIYRNIVRHRTMAMAAAMTFYSILAIFPAIAALVSLYGLFADTATIASHLDNFSGLLPAGALEVMRDQMTRLASQRGDTLGLTFVVGLSASLWSANAATKSLFDALNVVYDKVEKRGFIKLNANSLGLTFVAVVFALLAIGAIVVIPVLLKFIGLATITEILIKVARWPALLVVVTVIVAFIYHFGPDHKETRWRWITRGSAFAALAWLAASFLFSWYAANFGKYNETYGSLGAVIAFMMWLWVSAVVILIGAELDAEMERQNSHQFAPRSAWTNEDNHA
jgi:membrane protein